MPIANSDTVQAADALVTAINAHTWGTTVAAVRLWAVSYTLKELDTLRVTVVPMLRRFGLLARAASSWEDHFTLSLAIQKRHAGNEDEITNTVVDPIDGLADDIMHWLQATSISCSGFRARPVELINEAVALDEHFWEKRVFTTMINAVYRVGPP